MDMEFYSSAYSERKMRTRIFALLIKIAIIHILIIAGLMIYFPKPKPDIIIISSDHLKNSVNANTKDIKHIEKIIGDLVNK